jgi:hypothetical protein
MFKSKTRNSLMLYLMRVFANHDQSLLDLNFVEFLEMN